ncbi:unnamed protein product [Didymodactylos carnosus]|uniref:Slit n=2 Tax=Didymodactylos carnosus TaxID=1234261 RepID=A0A813S2Z6_9BILA|nr:unnamed protein product [Didymodactylos carnosus]CAF3577761.1 unnamed protein product [Didymodactylos carnosus]
MKNSIDRNISKLLLLKELQFNNLSIIRKDDLKSLRQLRILNLQDNQIHTIDGESFRDLILLEKLRLNSNKLNHILDGTFSALKQLQRLTLNYNNLTTLPLLPLARLLDLRVLRLHDNSFICDCRLLWLAKYLKLHPFLGLNARCQQPDTLNHKDITSLVEEEKQCNSMDADDIEYTCNVPICPHPCTCFNGVVDCKDKELNEIPRNIPDTTIELRLEKNRIIEIPPKVFSHLKKLRRFILYRNNLKMLPSRAFSDLSALQLLHLYNNQLVYLPLGIFNQLSHLQLLLLNANKITCVRGDAFEGLEKLSLLSLYDNQLKTLANETFIPLKSLQTLHLARNPFICDCHLRWLNAYLRDKQIETSGVRCAAPRRMAKRRFGVLNDRKFRCRNRMEFELTAHSGQCGLRCPKFCQCDGTTVTCRGQQLQEIPNDIPIFTTELHLQDNQIKRVPRDGSFRRLRSLRTLDLRNNRLEEIDDDAFDGASALNELFLTENNIQSITPQTFNGLKNIKTLMLRANKLTYIKNDTFLDMDVLKTLSLHDNRIKCIQPGSFDRLRSLAALDLLSNPFVCNCHMKWLKDWLKQSKIVTGYPKCMSPTKLRNIPIVNLTDDDFVCDPSEVDECDVSYPTHCPKNCSCYNHVVRCSHAQLTKVPFIDMPVDTEELYVVNFSLYLDANDIQEIPSGIGRLTYLVRIDLSYNKLRSIPDRIFENLTRLETLILSYNKIQCIETASFKGLKNLRILSLHGNEISTIPEGSFNDLQALSHVALGGNPLYCDCNLGWLSSWIKTDYVEPGIARCAGPPQMANKLLLTSPIFFFQCYNDSESNRYKQKCDPCLTDPCLNNGTCRTLSVEQYQCDCMPAYHGQQCEMTIDACFDNPCKNDGRCEALTDGRFRCHCMPGFTGYRCDININDCFQHRCENNATCIDKINAYNCLCPPMFTGRYCEQKLNWCDINLNPCVNNGQCVRLANGGYDCVCQPGFRGQNCSINFDDCQSHHCQFGICVDKLNGYVCKFCEIPPVVAPYQQSSEAQQCSTDFCLNNGACYERNGSIKCKCLNGFIGDRCDMLKSVTLNTNDSYIKLQKLNVYPRSNITIVFSTTNSTGVLVYFGNIGHMVAELFMGRVRVSYDVGNSPGSVMFSYDTVNDGKIHELQLISIGQNFSLTVDRGYTRHIFNRGQRKYLNITESLYVGGLPNELTNRALSLWHIREATSFQGCIHGLYINGDTVNFQNVDYRHKILPGCNDNDLMNKTCSPTSCKHGQCLLDGLAYRCVCHEDYTGITCSEAVLPPMSCGLTIETAYYIDPLTKCQSNRRLRLTKCIGTCSGATRSPSLTAAKWTADNSTMNLTSPSCCTPVDPKRR